MPTLVTETAGQPAAPGSPPHPDCGRAQQGIVGVVAEHRMLVAVHLLHRIDSALGRLPVRRMLAQHLGEGSNLPGQHGRRRVVREQLAQISAKHSDAAGLQPDHRHSGSERQP